MELSDQENVNQWRAHYRLEPFGGEQRLLAIIASQLWLLCCAEYTDRKALAKSVDELTKMFMPGDWVGQADNKKKPSAHEQLQAVRDQLAKVFPA